MYGPRGSMLGDEGVLDDYGVGSKRYRMMESNPYFSGGSGYLQSYENSYSESSAYSGSSPYIRSSTYGGNSGYRQSYGNGYTEPDTHTRSPAMSSFPVVRLRGLPFNCTMLDIHKFFAGLDVLDTLLVNRNGLFSGDAYVVFASPMQAEAALERHRQNIGHRYVEVFTSSRKDYYIAITSEVNSTGSGGDHRRALSPRPNKLDEAKDQIEFTEILKLRGLPYSATKREIVDFFSGFELNEDCVHIAKRPDGKATGEAFVEFASANEAKKAMSKDRMTIGSRYVELFPSSQEEIELSKW